MNEKIDGVFDANSYRYIPYDLRNEWKTLYNLFDRSFYDKMHLKYEIFPYIKTDFYNEELIRINNFENLCKKFSNKINNLVPKYENEKEYSEEVKNSLSSSINEILKFLSNKKTILNKNILEKNIPIKNTNMIEEFNQCNSLDKISKNRSIIILLIIIIIIFYINI